MFPIRPDVPNELPFGPPFVDMQAVPTAVVEGPDGAYYMSQLTGFPFPIGGANIYRVNPRTGAYKVFKGGFTNIMDLAFDKHGTLYVSRSTATAWSWIRPTAPSTRSPARASGRSSCRPTGR